MTAVVGTADPRLAARFALRLAELDSASLRRAPALPRGVDFCSNDYLGLAGDDGFRAAVARRIGVAATAGEPLFAPASRLLRGHLEVHERLEQRVAQWKGAEAALLFPSGWQANAALLGGLLQAGDRVLSDARNHASLIDGLRATAAERVVVPHLDLAAYARELARERPAGDVFVLVESLYSMDGDLAPLGELAALCQRHGASLVVDEAHAAGLYGTAGSGWIESCGVANAVLASVTTFGKALALQGAAIAGSRALITLLVNRARPFVFSTAISPLLLYALEEALDVVAGEPERRTHCHANALRLRGLLADAGLAVERQGGPIVPLVLGANDRALEAASRIRARGFDVRAVRPPTVPAGTARLRISVHADHSPAEIDGLAAAVVAVLSQLGGS